MISGVDVQNGVDWLVRVLCRGSGRGFGARRPPPGAAPQLSRLLPLGTISGRHRYGGGVVTASDTLGHDPLAFAKSLRVPIGAHCKT